MTVETLYVNNFTADQQQWQTHVGATPWLDNVAGHLIGTYTNGYVDRNFEYANTAIDDFTKITKIEMVIDSRENGDMWGANEYLSKDGTNWTLIAWVGGYGDSNWHTYKTDVTNKFTSLADINNARIKLVCAYSGPQLTGNLRYAHLDVTYTSGEAAAIGAKVQVMQAPRPKPLFPKCAPRSLFPKFSPRQIA
jgi:hypothetical protein